MRQKAARIALAWVYPLFLLLTLGGAAILTTGCSSSSDDTPELLNVAIPVDFPALARAISPYATRVDWNLDPLVGNTGGTARSGSIARTQDGAHTVTGTTTATAGDYALTLRAFAGSAPDPVGTVTQNITIARGAENSFNYSADVSDNFADGGSIEVSGPAAVDNGGTAQYTVVGKNADGDVIISTITENVIWGVTGGIGTVDASGMFTATTVGNGSVDASVAGKSDSAPVTVNAVGPQPGNLTVNVAWDAFVPARGLTGQSNSCSVVVTDTTPERNVIARKTGNRPNSSADTSAFVFDNLGGGDVFVTVEGYAGLLDINLQPTGQKLCSGSDIPANVDGNTTVNVTTQVDSVIARYAVWYVVNSAATGTGGSPPGGAIALPNTGGTIQCTFDPNAAPAGPQNYVKLFSQALDANNNVILPPFDTFITYTKVNGPITLDPSDNQNGRFRTAGVGTAQITVGANGNPSRTVDINITGTSGNGSALVAWEDASNGRRSVFVASIAGNGAFAAGPGVINNTAAGLIGTTYANLPAVGGTTFNGDVSIQWPTLSADGSTVFFVVNPVTTAGPTQTTRRGDIWSCPVNVLGGAVTFGTPVQITTLADDRDDQCPALGSNGDLFWCSNQMTLVPAQGRVEGTPIVGAFRALMRRTGGSNGTFFQPTSFQAWSPNVTPDMSGFSFIEVGGATDNGLAAAPTGVLRFGAVATPGTSASSAVYTSQFAFFEPASQWDRGSGQLLVWNPGTGNLITTVTSGANALNQATQFINGALNGRETFIDDVSTPLVIDPKLCVFYNTGGAVVFRLYGTGAPSGFGPIVGTGIPAGATRLAVTSIP